MPETPARVFSAEELRIAGTRSVDALCDALDAGDVRAALDFSRRLRREVLSMLGNYDSWEVGLLDVIRERESAEVVAEALSAIEDPSVAPERCELSDDPSDAWRATARQIVAAIESDDFARAKSLAHGLQDDALARHDRGLSRVTAILSWIGRRGGPTAVEAALDRTMSSVMLGDASFRERAEALMHFTRVHLQSFELEEDDEKLTFLCPVCPSGGRSLRAGHYSPPRDNLVIQGPSRLTYGLPELPVYCCHEPVVERQAIEETGVPLFIVDPSDALGHKPCRTYLYKDPAAIPERFYTRVGLSKPKPE